MKQIYLDTDDEITAIISKIESFSSEKIAIIPPKRSAALQSVVNLKLLKKAAEGNDSELILITRDPAILNIASQLTLLTAPNLEAEPTIPEPAVSRQELPSQIIDGSQPTESDLKSADKAASTEKPGKKRGKGKKGGAAGDAKPKRGSRIPDFDKFKKWLLIGLGVVLLLGLGVWALFNLLPHADVSVQGRTQEVNTEFEFMADPEVEESDIESGVLAAQTRQMSRTLSSTFDATGEKMVGDKATGEITISNCQSSNPITIDSGTAFTTANELVYISDQAVTVPGGTFEPSCNSPGTATVDVTADEIGEEYNISPTTYTVEGYSPDNMSGQGFNMSGGSEEEVTIISQSDIDGARQKLLESEEESILEDLKRQFDDNHYIIEASFNDDITETTSEPDVGEEADEGRLILQVTYTVLAVEEEDMVALLDFQHREQASEGSDGLSAIETGIEEAEFSAQDDELAFTVEADGILGPNLEVDRLREEISGLTYTEAIDHIESIPNVTRVQIDLSPFWSSNVPKNPDNIDIEFDLSDLFGDGQEEEG